MQYNPTSTPKVVATVVGLGAATLLPKTGSGLVDSLAVATAGALLVWAVLYFAMRKKAN